MSWSNGPSDPNGAYQQRSPHGGFFDSMRNSGWYRAQPRVIGGVCSGVAARTGWDLSLIRVLTVLAAFFAPVVLIAYSLAWLFLPEAADGRIHAEETTEGRFDIAFLGGVFMAVVGLSSVVPSVSVFGGFALGWGAFTTLVIVGVCIAAAAAARAKNPQGAPMPGPTNPRYGTPQYGNPQYGNPQYGTPQYGTPGAGPQGGASGPFGQGASTARNREAPTPTGQPANAAGGFPSHGAPFAASPAGVNSQQAGRGPASPSQPHPGWTPPPASAPRPRTWNAPPAPTHRPRTVSSRVNLAITGLLILVFAAVFGAMYVVSEGHTIPFVAGADIAQTHSRIIVIGGGVCLLIVGFSLAIAALRDRTAGWLMALSIIGMILALPTAAIGTEAAHERITQAGPSLPGSSANTTLDWKTDSVQGGNPTGSTTLDLTGAPVGTTKTITVGWRAWSNLSILITEGQPIQIVCKSDIGSVSTNMRDDGWAAPLKMCSGETTVSSPSWGNSALGGITILIDDSADLETLSVMQSPDTSNKWGSAPSTSSPSTTPSAAPSATPSDASQSGN